MNRKSDVVYCKNLLQRSETFVLDHFDSLPANQKFLVGLHQLEDAFVELPTNTHIVGCSPIESMIFELFGYSHRISKTLTKLSPRVVHAHFANQGSQLDLICRSLHIPLVISCHGRDVFRHDSSLKSAGLSERLWQRRRLGLCNLNANFVAVSKFVARRLEDLGVRGDRIHVVANPLNVQEMPFVLEGRHENTILFVGRLVEKKGVSEALSAIELLMNRFKKMSFRIVGDGPARIELEAKANSLNIPVVFLGTLTRQEVISEMLSATVLLVPSRRAADGDVETFGVVAAEAQACGLPVVVTPHGGLPEVVIDGEGGIVAEGINSRHIADALEVMLSSKEKRLNIGAAGRKSVFARFDSSVIGKKFDSLYEKLSIS